MSRIDADLVIRGCLAATMVPSGRDPYGLVHDAAIAIDADRIVDVGPSAEVEARVAARSTRDAAGLLVTPGLVDCHTHVVFGGDRLHEFELRARGASYEELARAGGGILATVAATRAASDAELVESAARRLRMMADGGVCTVEVKSGYGLGVDDELRMLRAARAAGERAGVDVRTTLLPLHALPPDRERDEFVREACDELLPRAVEEGLVDAVDAFCEGIAFTATEVDTLFTRARALGVPVKLHADQLSDGGGAALAAKHGALSADHLEHALEEGIAALARAGTVAVVLPGATVTLRSQARPPIDALRRAGVPIAVSTDANPGSSPLLSLLVAAHLSCTVLGLVPDEAFAGITRHAAAAVGRAGELGVVTPGALANLAAWDARHPADLVYWCAGHRPVARFQRGKEAT